MTFFHTVRGTGPVAESSAIEAIAVLLPVLGQDATDEGVKVVIELVQRMPSQALSVAILDWWLVTTKGASSPVGHAFHLPEVVPQPLRDAMRSVSELQTEGLVVPAGRWIFAARELGERIAELDTKMQLDSYGKSKLTGERTVWAHLVERLEPTTEALRAGRRAERFELDMGDYEGMMATEGIDENSRRWKEMRKRADECVAFVSAVVALQQIVEPWRSLSPPEPLVAFPDAAAVLGPMATTLLATVLDESLVDMTATSNIEPLRRVCTHADPRDLAWLAFTCEAGLRGFPGAVPALDAICGRRARAARRIDALRAEGMDLDTAEVHLLDHELDEAETEIERVDAGRRTDRRTQALRDALAALGAEAEGEALPADWQSRLGEALQAARGDDLDRAEQLRKALDRDLRGVRRAAALKSLRLHLEALESLRAPATLLAELREALTGAEAAPERAVDPDVVARSGERAHAIRSQREQEAAAAYDEASLLLDGERESIQPDALSALELRLAEAEENIGDGEIMAALDVLTEVLDSIRSERIRRWAAAEGEDVLVEHVIDFCTQQVHFDHDDVRRLLVAAKTKPFVILAGLTGSGKSTIARLFAGALGADSRNGRFRRIAVRPDWIDQSEVIGGVHPVSNHFEPGWLAEVARQCERNPDQLHVVLLDEMNLAPVEQYLAEYLSALEEARSGSADTRLPLYSSGMSPTNAADWPSSLEFPLNLIVIGTVNVDETTRALSDRVIDRANVLQLSVSVSGAHHHDNGRAVRPWSVPFREWEAICTMRPDPANHDLLVDMGEVLQTVGIGVGQRAHIELERFVANAHGILAPARSLDLGVLQRIIPKVRGFKRDLADGLGELHELLVGAGCERSAAVVARWLGDRVSDDEFLDGTDARIGLVA